MTPLLATTYFDGRSPRPQSVGIQMQDDMLHITGDGINLSYARKAIRWPERQTYGQRQCNLPDGAMLQHADGVQWDAWFAASGGQESSLVAWMQNWRRTFYALTGTVTAVAVAWAWGIPLAAGIVTHLLPPSVDKLVGEQAFTQLERAWLRPTTVTASEQAVLQKRFRQMVTNAYPDVPEWKLNFYQSKALGANAFALPGGQIVITDELTKLLQDQPDTLMGVLGHELGHVQHRHGMAMVVKASLVSALISLIVGDATSFLATVPTILATQGYSRDSEREADEKAAELLHLNGIRPAVMIPFFESIRSKNEDKKSTLPIALAGHPNDTERIQFFRSWQAPSKH